MKNQLTKRTVRKPLKEKREHITKEDATVMNNIIFGPIKWYRQWKGGTWVLVEGAGKYWANRKPYPYELTDNSIYVIEEYEEKPKK